MACIAFSAKRTKAIADAFRECHKLRYAIGSGQIAAPISAISAIGDLQIAEVNNPVFRADIYFSAKSDSAFAAARGTRPPQKSLCDAALRQITEAGDALCFWCSRVFWLAAFSFHHPGTKSGLSWAPGRFEDGHGRYWLGTKDVGADLFGCQADDGCDGGDVLRRDIFPLTDGLMGEAAGAGDGCDQATVGADLVDDADVAVWSFCKHNLDLIPSVIDSKA